MKESHRALIVFSLPVLFLIFAFFFMSFGTPNERREESGDSGPELAESRLQNEEAYPKVTRESIAELETELIAPTEISDAIEEVSTGDRITVHYRGWLATDSEAVFDQSFNRNEPFTFTVGSGVINGWSEGVVGMKVGEIRRLFIPSDLGYGEQGSGANIPPNSDLIFDVELVRFE